MPKVLVVDDDDAVRRVVGMLLAQAGYSVILAAYGQIGCRRAQSDKPDLETISKVPSPLMGEG